MQGIGIRNADRQLLRRKSRTGFPVLSGIGRRGAKRHRPAQHTFLRQSRKQCIKLPEMQLHRQ